METDEENCAANLKRQREPLSDAEENTNFAAGLLVLNSVFISNLCVETSLEFGI